MAFTESLSTFFRTNDFAVSATFSEDESDVTVNGVFENVYSEDLSVRGSLPTFVCVESDVESVSIDGSLTVDGTAYTVRNKKPDGTGVTTLVLEAQ
tara:strand:+ start:716 stop:1003 length:288 start_codon:yes stop_codon:yes gene_type:complete